MSVLQAQTFQEDFEQERKDREKAHSQVAEIKQRYQHQLQSMVEQLDRTAQELEHTKKDLNKTRKRFDRYKDTHSTTETLIHSQLEKLSDRLIERDQEVAAVGKVKAHKVTVRPSHVTVTISCVHWWDCILSIKLHSLCVHVRPHGSYIYNAQSIAWKRGAAAWCLCTKC